MPRIHPTAAAMLSFALAAPPVLAQARRPFAGVVRLPDGSPAAAALVTWVAVATDGTTRADADVVRAVADATGRFRVDLADGRVYSGWAMAAHDDTSGMRAVSAVVENLPVVAPTAFVLAAKRRARPIVVEQAAAWAAFGVATLRVAPLARGVSATSVPIAADGTATIPPLAGHSLLAEVLDADGGVVFRCELAADAPNLPLPPPQPIPVHVVDDAGAPVAGAVVAHEVQLPPRVHGALVPEPGWPEFRIGATTDASGDATLLVASAVSPLVEQPRLLCNAWREGFVEALSGFDGEQFEDARAGQASPGRLRFVLHRTPPCSVRVLDRDGRPDAGRLVWLRARCDVQLTGLTGSHERVWIARTGDDGIAVLDRVAATEVLEIAVDACAALHPGQLRGGRDFVVDARDARAFALQVLDADGAPAANALLRVVPIADSWPDPLGSTTRLDAAGRAPLALPPGEWLITVTDGSGFAIETIAADRTGAPLPLRMARLATMRVAAIPPGEPPAGPATIGLVQVGRVGEASTAARAVDQVATWLALALVDGAVTDAHGEATLRFVPRDPAYTLRCQLWRARTWSSTFDVFATDEIARVQLSERR